MVKMIYKICLFEMAAARRLCSS